METKDNDKKIDKDDSKNLFQIMGEIIDQLNNTKKLFIAMILTVMIIPPVVFVITFELLEANASTLHSIESSHNKGEHRENFLRSETLLFTLTGMSH
jgi:TRAP-type mannitol/chloroaromatic compound transport system permease small subunit